MNETMKSTNISNESNISDESLRTNTHKIATRSSTKIATRSSTKSVTNSIKLNKKVKKKVKKQNEEDQKKGK